MLASKLYSPTLRELPSDAVVMSHKYMLKAGMMRKIANGTYAYLPLAFRSIQKIENIIRTEINKTGAQEILMPIIQPAEIWQATGRWNVYGEEMFKLKDRHGRDYCLAPTHEEMVTTLIQMDTNSYKKLPVSVYQIQNKYRDEKRPRFGLMRSREFIMKDGYTFDADEEGMNKQYELMYDAYTRIFTRCGLKFRPVIADSGAIGGNASHEFEVLADSGEADIVYCKDCDFAANIEAVKPNTLTSDVKNDKEKEIVQTPGQHTIEKVCNYLHLPVKSSVKAVVYKLDDTVVLAMVRGDHEVNEVRLQSIYNAINVDMASDEDLKACGLTAGYISPIGLKTSEHFDIICDASVMEMQDACCGANVKDEHYIHVNPARDFGNVKVDTIRQIDAGDVCPHCGGKIVLTKGIEVGQVFKLGTKYSEKLDATFLDNNGKSRPMFMGCYGIGVTRTVAASIEQNHDENGIIWPVAIAPYEVVIVPANNKSEDVMKAAEGLYNALESSQDEIVFDDRAERAGIKFKDADLIGYPLRVTIGKKWQESGCVEIKLRRTGEVFEVPYENCAEKVEELLNYLRENNL
ncbi:MULTISPECIES: proline--tRNA ligase [Dialister]|jgi:prolyl-tRNA synthetase|uniref:proline--tRNA ligase n=1 Tax=Dialister TaxID=39948 RepID=UPI0003385393|nr:proline--tRNA ligase [Dialister sp.]MEE1349035.1 proline--tRNA ligase [Dialister hominis]HJI42608.1 proline--tRNA ligase [Veillonellaceae bacterium]MBS6413332.1 proline--tRNA ligase [Dialister sp.]MCH3912258.1 proline--tRNA ligase [Dialister sp.]MCH3929986.1 proline--tRNA ligase [Dialister sp.]